MQSKRGSGKDEDDVLCKRDEERKKDEWEFFSSLSLSLFLHLIFIIINCNNITDAVFIYLKIFPLIINHHRPFDCSFSLSSLIQYLPHPPESYVIEIILIFICFEIYFLSSSSSSSSSSSTSWFFLLLLIPFTSHF